MARRTAICSLTNIFLCIFYVSLVLILVLMMEMRGNMGIFSTAGCFIRTRFEKGERRGAVNDKILEKYVAYRVCLSSFFLIVLDQLIEINPSIAHIGDTVFLCSTIKGRRKATKENLRINTNFKSVSIMATSSALERDRQEDTVVGMTFDPSKPLLFQLPKGLFVAILSDWVGLEGIHNLDSAIVNHTYRERFLSCLEAIRSPCLGRFGAETRDSSSKDSDAKSEDSSTSFSCYSLRWLSLRRIQVEHVHLDWVLKKVCFGVALQRSIDKEVELLRDIDLPWLRSLKVL